MIGIKGYKLKTVAAYEKKQKEIAADLKIKDRYAGRKEKGKVYPDITLADGSYFIPYEKGNYIIVEEDINKFNN